MFEPWKGGIWASPNNALRGRRLLVLGESHYSSKHEVGAPAPDMTQWVVEHYLNGGLASGAKGFFTRIGGILAGRGAEGEAESYDPHSVWSSIVFYNYVPVIVGSGPRQRPTPPMWEMGEVPFREVIRRCEAEAVLVLGRELWDQMPASDEPAFTFQFSGEDKWARRYFLHGSADRSPYRVTATYVNHPSSRGWTAARWRPAVDFLLSEIEAERIRNGDPT